MVYQSKTKQDLLPNTRVATLQDFRNAKGNFNCRKRKYYYWCQSNLTYMVWYTFPYDSKEAMQDQINCLKKRITNNEIIVDV